MPRRRRAGAGPVDRRPRRAVGSRGARGRSRGRRARRRASAGFRRRGMATTWRRRYGGPPLASV